MTSCCITRSYRKARHRLGTVYGAYTLNAQDTGINCCGTLTITLPAVPSDGQTITINNVCTGTVTVDGGDNNIGSAADATLAAGESGTFIWGGYSWGAFIGSSCTETLPADYDFGTVEYSGPFETEPAVPATTVVTSVIGYSACGDAVRLTVTKVYSGRSVANGYKVYFPGGSSLGAGEIMAAMPAAYYYGDTLDEAHQAALATTAGLGWYSIQTLYLWTSNVKSIVPTATTRTLYGDRFKNGNPYITGGQLAYVVSQYTAQLTLYYLDLRETWTYDTV